MNQPRCSIYIPNYNYARYLRKCLDSVLQQQYPNLEILIIDDGSTDGSQEIIEAYAKKDERIRYWLMPHKGIRWGQGYINMAFREATGEFFVICDSDDYLEPDFWEQVLPYFARSEIGLVRIGCYGFGERDIEGTWIRPLPMVHPSELLKQNKVFISSPFRMEVWKKIGDWDDNISWSDWDFWIRATMRGGWSWASCNRPLFWHRAHGKQLRATSNYKVAEDMIIYLQKKHADLLKIFRVSPGFV